ncbi:MAG: hypothetical protein KAW09_04010, partial [Thermoplasmata archaeon]|nr:hypothetical protein [Thermoplasmata archaeon]
MRTQGGLRSGLRRNSVSHSKRGFRITSIIIAVAVSCLTVDGSLGIITDRAQAQTEPTLLVLEQNYSNMASLPNNVFQGYTLALFVANTTLTFNSTAKAVEFSRTSTTVGDLFVTGQHAFVNCTYELKVIVERQNWNAVALIFLGESYLGLQVRVDNSRRVYSYYYNEIGVLQSPYLALPSSVDKSFNLTLVRNGWNKTSNLSIDGQTLWTPLTWNSVNQLPYAVPASQYMKVSFSLSISTWARVKLLYFSQTVDRSFIMPFAPTDLMPFGFDGPHPLDTIVNGIAYMVSKGHRGTIWLDQLYAWYTDDAVLAFFRDLINNKSWEAGIHFSVALTSETLNRVKAVMTYEHQNISSRLGMAPVSWCSLAGADNVSHAQYGYTELGMVWRNGYSGVRREPNIGNLHDAVWPFWNDSLGHHFIHPAFTHRTDVDPAIQYSISYSKFVYWIDAYTAEGISLVPFGEFYGINQNTGIAGVVISERSNGYVSFSLSTNDYPAYLRVDDTLAFWTLSPQRISNGTNMFYASAGNYYGSLRVLSVDDIIITNASRTDATHRWIANATAR